MKKSSMLTFFFAFVPGAGQMYLGMIRRGVSIMLAFSLITAVCGALNLPFFALLLPVLWFFAFFDTFNIRAMSYEERLANPDKFLFRLDEVFKKDWQAFLSKRHMIIGWGLVILGLYLLLRNIMERVVWVLAEYFPWVESLFRSIPTLILAVVIIFFGLHLVTGGKRRKSLPPANDDFTEYGGTKHE